MKNLYRRFTVKSRWGDYINSYSTLENPENAKERAINCAKHPSSMGDVWGEDFDGELHLLWGYKEEVG